MDLILPSAFLFSSCLNGILQGTAAISTTGMNHVQRMIKEEKAVPWVSVPALDWLPLGYPNLTELLFVTSQLLAAKSNYD